MAISNVYATTPTESGAIAVQSLISSVVFMCVAALRTSEEAAYAE